MSNGATIPADATVADVFNKYLKERIEGTTIPGIQGVIQFQVTGEGGGNWHITIKEGKGEVGEGEHASPNTTFVVEGSDFLAMVKREVDGQQLFMQGKLRVMGDMAIAMQLGQLIRQAMAQQTPPAPPAPEGGGQAGPEAEKIAAMSEEEFQKLLETASVRDVFDRYLPARIKPAFQQYKELLAGVTGVLQFEITGDDGGEWYFVIQEDDVEVRPGKHESPTTTFQLASEDYLAMNRRQADPQTLFMQGKLRVLGDMGLAMRLGQVMQSALSSRKN